ncbi:proteasome complex subunit Rpn13 ubiquitin receptor-domain-containing protein [Mycotypha africana]|uniref:proteasome complex subunit Rpn13 ubiquitin receptor-domain-containing protein n=1 Tax=Mycotypha africana TaxID=64632 RepID=UPI0023014A3B|nr:proteasome complex subunit Rpn13 ubiquitin receptor-domain-containing protein [Mycotypha africana]KAI8977121.1 proteasome complex subunit Rpn13 ubiquitin receptor-domain-containing protein [Mycotypha africana]
MSLFPTAQRNNNHLVEFNAGKVIKEGNMLKPDTRKGVIYMDQSDDQLMHFYWKERKAADPEDDFIIFPDEAELIHVHECTTGRVYVLKFKSSSQKVFYWMQSKNDEKDEELVNRVNQLINDPQSAMSGSGHRDGNDLEYEGNVHSDLMQILGGGQGDLDMNMTQDNLLQFIQNAGGLSNLSSSIDIEARIPASKWTEAESTLAETNAPEQPVTLELGDALAADTLNSILREDDIRSALFPFVNEGNKRSEEEIEQLVQSEEFKRRLQVINAALEQDKLDSLVEALQTDKDLKSFLKAVGYYAKHKNEGRTDMDVMEED